MLQRRLPLFLRHAPAPGARGFAALTGFEAISRGMLVSVYPLSIYQFLGDEAAVSLVYLAAGLVSLLVALAVPWLNRYVPRRWLYGCATLVFLAGTIAGAMGGSLLVASLLLTTLATVALFVCVNAYVLDYIERVELGRCETLRMFYSGLGWSIGPMLGVYLYGWWAPAPFVISGSGTFLMLLAFLYMRLGDGKLIQKAHGPAANPLAYLGRFASQPRLVTGWIFAVIRSAAWWVYVVYLPIYAINAGLGNELGGTILSATNALLFISPFMLTWMQRRSVRIAVRTGFMATALLSLMAWGMAWVELPVLSVASLAAGSFFLVLLDICGGLPFLMAVKPSERTEMSAIYSTFRDVSGVVTPFAAWLVLLVMPLSGLFAVSGLALMGCWMLAGKLHPRLGQRRIKAPVPEPVPEFLEELLPEALAPGEAGEPG